MPQANSPRPRPSAERPQDATCSNCGTKYIATHGSGGCPRCASKSAVREPGELVKKVIDDNDLKKA